MIIARNPKAGLICVIRVKIAHPFASDPNALPPGHRESCAPLPGRAGLGPVFRPCARTHTWAGGVRHAICPFSSMNAVKNDRSCSICGGRMQRVKVLPKHLGPLIRYKCTCGHCEDLKEEETTAETSQGSFVLEGFQEIV